MTIISTRHKQILDKQGIAITYRQVTNQSRNSTTLKKTNTFTDVVIKAHLRKFAQKEITGLVKEGDRQMRISADSVSFVPKTNDLVTTTEGKFNVVTVDKRTADGVDVVYICVIRGIDQ